MVIRSSPWTIAVWLHGYENSGLVNSGLVRSAVERLRRISTRFRQKGLRRLHSKRTGGRLPLVEYLSRVVGFRQNYAILFDQVAAATATHMTEPELGLRFEQNQLEDLRISLRHGNPRRGSGHMPSATS